MRMTRSCCRAKSSQWSSSLLNSVLITMIVIMVTAASAGTAFAVERIYQKEVALEDYSTGDYQLIFNENVSRAGGGSGSTMKSVAGQDMQFKPLAYPGAGNPQSMAVSADGKTAWIMSAARSGNDNSRTGRIYKVDLSKYWGEDAKGDKDPVVKVGPSIVSGHGQTLAYNSKDDELWYVRETKTYDTTLVQVDKDTLEPIKEIHFKFSNRVVYPPTFTFDREGNLWTWTRSAGTSWAPAGTVRFYKGRIEDDHVSFRMIKQGIRYTPGRFCQGMGYNPANDRLYVISDGVVLTVPASRMGKITKDDVDTIIFDHGHEFEGMAFSEMGCAYFLTNNPCEIMRDEVSYKAAIAEEERIEQITQQYSKHKDEIAGKEEEETREIIKEQIGDIVKDGI